MRKRGDLEEARRARTRSSSSTTRRTSSAIWPTPWRGFPEHRRNRRRRPRRRGGPDEDEAEGGRRCRRGGRRPPVTMRLVAAELVDSRQILPGQWLQSFHAPELATGCRAGQFVHVRTGDYSGLVLRRPFSINTAIRPRGIITLHFRTVGRGTEWLTRTRAGERLDMLGPLGRAVRGRPAKPAPAARRRRPRHGRGPDARRRGDPRRPPGHAPVRGAERRQVYPSSLLPDEVEYVVATDDGSLGHHGFVTELVPQYEAWADQAFACGPHPMLAAAGAAGGRSARAARRRHARRASVAAARPIHVGSTAARRKAFLQVSMEQTMGCAVGACLGCVVMGVEGPLRVCREGPVFAADEIDWPAVVERDPMTPKRRIIHFGDMRLGVDADRSKRTPTVRKSKGAIEPVDRFKVPASRPRVEAGSSAVADLGAPTAARPTLAERAALDRIDLSVDLAPERGCRCESHPRRLGHVRLRHRIRRGRRRPAPRRDLLQGNDAEAAGRQSAPARDRDAGRDAQFDRPAEPRRRRGHREVRPDLAGLAGAGHRQRGRRVDRGLRRGRPPAGRRARRGRHRAEHQLPERRQGRAAVRDRPRRRPGRDRSRSPCHGAAAAGQALARTWRTSGRSPGRSRTAGADAICAINTLSGIAVVAGSDAGRSWATSTAGCPGRRSSPSRCGSSTKSRRSSRSRSWPSAASPNLDDVLDFLAAARSRSRSARRSSPTRSCRSAWSTSCGPNAVRRGLDSYRPLIGTALPKRTGAPSAKGAEYRP